MTSDTRNRIIQACERTIAHAGLRGFRMQDVAREAGVSIGLLSYHFGDRNGLLQAALDHVNQSTADRAGRVPNTTSASDRLSALLSSEFGDDPHIREGSIAWNELRAVSVFESSSAAALTRSTADWQASVSALVTEAATSADTDMMALILTSLVEGLSGRWLTGQISAAEAQVAVRTALHEMNISSNDTEPKPFAEDEQATGDFDIA